MEKKILEQYIDACELVKETEEDIRKLRKKRKTIVQTSVRGSMPDFPYASKHFHIEGTPYSCVDDSRLRLEEKLLEQRKEDAEKIKLDVEAWMNTLPVRMQRIIRFRIMRQMSWEDVATKIGGKATTDSVRMEFERFFKEK